MLKLSITIPKTLYYIFRSYSTVRPSHIPGDPIAPTSKRTFILSVHPMNIRLTRMKFKLLNLLLKNRNSLCEFDFFAKAEHRTFRGYNPPSVTANRMSTSETATQNCSAEIAWWHRSNLKFIDGLSSTHQSGINRESALNFIRECEILMQWTMTWRQRIEKRSASAPSLETICISRYSCITNPRANTVSWILSHSVHLGKEESYSQRYSMISLQRYDRDQRKSPRQNHP
jgi:hypothetical protein